MAGELLRNYANVVINTCPQPGHGTSRSVLFGANIRDVLISIAEICTIIVTMLREKNRMTYILLIL